MLGTHVEAGRDAAIEPTWEHKDFGEQGTPALEVAEEAQCRKETEDGLRDEPVGSFLGDGEEEEVPPDTQTATYHCARRDCDRLAGHTLGSPERCANEPEAAAVLARPLVGEGENARAAQKYGRDQVHDY